MFLLRVGGLYGLPPPQWIFLYGSVPGFPEAIESAEVS
jgi:hypothetical protein